MITSAWAFLLDENMPKRVAHILRGAGYPAARVIEVGLRAQPDSLIFAYARTRRLIIITRDADYLDAARFRPPTLAPPLCPVLPGLCEGLTTMYRARYVSQSAFGASVAALLIR